jgi:hypothetical protein
MSVSSILAKALSSVIASIDPSDDEEIDPDFAMTILEPIAALLQEASAEERAEISGLFQAAAEAEASPDRREVIAGLPEGLGLR